MFIIIISISINARPKYWVVKASVLSNVFAAANTSSVVWLSGGAGDQGHWIWCQRGSWTTWWPIMYLEGMANSTCHRNVLLHID